MNIQKVRFIEPGNLPYKASFKNLFTYEKYTRTPSHGLMTLATIVKSEVDDTYMYSESIWHEKILYLGDCLWQYSVRVDLKRELPNLPKAG